MDKESMTEEPKADNRPSPADFDIYLPWACKQLQLEATVQVTKMYQNEYVSITMTDRSKKGKSKGRLTHSRTEVKVEQEKEDQSASATAMKHVFNKGPQKVIKILSIYDIFENLVQIKFDKNKYLPRVMIKIVALIIKFQNYLNNITINGGLDNYTVYEICKFLPTSHITEMCLDDCYLREPNYHILLEQANFLKYLSLCRCKIDDNVVESMSALLIYPLPASKSLSILNLSSNRITDSGAEAIANALRSNRQLSYLNLASNIITDKGASAILDTLIEFPLTAESILATKSRQMAFLKKKNEMLALTIRDLRLGDIDRKIARRKSMRPASTAPKKVKGEASQKSLVDPRYIPDVDNTLLEKAATIVDNAIGNFSDPFSITNTVVRNDITYCKGNNVLCNLNLSYNTLTYLTLRKLKSVLLYQKLTDRKPKGLMGVSVEGNSMPIACKELSQIDDILEFALIAQTRRTSGGKKRTHSKTMPRHFDI